MSERQEFYDSHYWKHGPCCAGCDHWQSLRTGAGECTKAAPVSGSDRAAMLGISGSSLAIGAGHPLTRHSHHCGDFKDDFDWSSLPAAYQARVGVKPKDGMDV